MTHTLDKDAFIKTLTSILDLTRLCGRNGYLSVISISVVTNAQDNDKNKALYSAILNDSIDEVQKLLNEGVKSAWAKEYFVFLKNGFHPKNIKRLFFHSHQSKLDRAISG